MPPKKIKTYGKTSPFLIDDILSKFKIVISFSEYSSFCFTKKDLYFLISNVTQSFTT